MRLQRHYAVQRKLHLLADTVEQAPQEAGDVRHVSHQQQVARLAGEPVRQNVGRVGRLQAAHHREGGQRIARQAERLAGLPRPQLAAVPDLHRGYAARSRLLRKPPDRRATGRGQRPLRVDARVRRLAVMNQMNHDPSIPRQCALVQTSGRSSASTVTTSRRPIHMAAVSVSLLTGCSPA